MIPNPIECQCIEVKQPIGAFYVARISPSDLTEITYVDVRRIEKEARDIETVLGIQRPLSMARAREIGEYVNTVDATFPSSIILEINSFDDEEQKIRNIFFDKNKGTLEIRRDNRVAKVLDGQHRIEGLNDLRPENHPFDIVVTIFVDADVEQQALIFATINKTQTKVNKSLVYDLFEFAKNRSPEKTCHNIAILLNKVEKSPFKDRIKILGTADDSAMETLTQATFVEAVLKYVSKEPMKDRDFLKRNPDKKLPLPSSQERRSLFLREWFINGEDAKIALLLMNYFSAVQARWPDAWNSTDAGLILNRTTGFLALMRFLRDACVRFDIVTEIPAITSFKTLFDRVSLTDEDFTKERFIPGSTGQRVLYELFKNANSLPT